MRNLLIGFLLGAVVGGAGYGFAQNEQLDRYRQMQMLEQQNQMQQQQQMQQFNEQQRQYAPGGTYYGGGGAGFNNRGSFANPTTPCPR